ncbi:polyphosphate kinase 2 family protein [Dongia soli]|uniref:Polyphosphate kinase 2 family protein n=1 Tax=Dongia soli TaxID=600628 RepID=A0ABU5EEY0_9PROT|nr:polyphosphate kinase 2 family protein [Dongia soli]MDY0884911.1 polyphosphate kinase 2 family protein [Dongia soli]
MDMKRIVEASRSFAAPYRITDGRKFRLKDCDPDDIANFKEADRQRAKDALALGTQALAELQDKLYAQNQWGLLLIFQAMDAAGKDGAIKHVMSGVNPQGCQVFSFKSPSSEELDHDFMWRCAHNLPERGRIGIFNRSYYEEVLAVRVHPDYLRRQNLPPSLVTKDIWQERFEDIGNFERYLTRNGFKVIKFYLNVSRDEQKKRFLERLENPEKNWKFSAADASERSYWKDYAKAYEEMIEATASKHAPWYVVPADNKWFTRVVVAAAIIDALDSLDLDYPKVSEAQKKELAAARTTLLEE